MKVLIKLRLYQKTPLLYEHLATKAMVIKTDLSFLDVHESSNVFQINDWYYTNNKISIPFHS